jgi:hypothetical protein
VIKETKCKVKVIRLKHYIVPIPASSDNKYDILSEGHSLNLPGSSTYPEDKKTSFNIFSKREVKLDPSDSKNEMMKTELFSLGDGIVETIEIFSIDKHWVKNKKV